MTQQSLASHNLLNITICNLSNSGQIQLYNHTVTNIGKKYVIKHVMYIKHNYVRYIISYIVTNSRSRYITRCVKYIIS